MLSKIFGLEPRTVKVITGAGVGQDSTLNRVFGASSTTSAGVEVTVEGAQTLSAVYRAITLISSTIASLPLMVYERVNEKGDKEPARKHPAFRLLHSRPNPEMTAFFYRQSTILYTLLYGRHYTYIERDGRGQVVGLWPMRTGDVGRSRLAGGLMYDVSRVQNTDMFPRPPFASNTQTLMGHEVMELTTHDGESIIGRAHAQEQLGESLAAQQFGSGFYAGGAQPYFVITAPGRVDGEEFRKNWEKSHGGSKRKMAVLQNGMEAKTLGMPLNDAQFLESRKFYVTEVARWFGVPPHKLMDLERATFSNIEEQQLEWYEGLLPWLEMVEQEADRQLLTPTEAERLFFEHNVDGLLRGNIAARYAAYAKGIQWGWLNRNQVRQRENLNSMGEDGDVYMVPSNMQAAKKLTEPTPEPAPMIPQAPAENPDDPTEEGDVDGTIEAAARTALVQAVDRMIDKEAGTIRKAAMRADSFIPWLEEYRKHWPRKWADGLIPAMRAVKSLNVHVNDSPAVWENRCSIVFESLLDLTGHTTAKELTDRVSTEVGKWPTAEEIVNQLTKGE